MENKKKLYDAIRTDNIYFLVSEMNKIDIKREDIVQFICNDTGYILIFQFEDGK